VSQAFFNVGWAVLFSAIGAVIGACLVIVTAGILPRLINKMTPAIDEEKEILRGNAAVAQYFGRITAASIIGISIVVAAAVLGGLLSALHG
jgi:hypothetical protein